MKKATLIAFATLLSATALFATAQELFKYTDKEGSIHYVQDPMTIPPEYRGGEQKVNPDTGVNLNMGQAANPDDEDGNMPGYVSPNLVPGQLPMASPMPGGATSVDDWEKKAYCERKMLETLKSLKKDIEAALSRANTNKAATGNPQAIQQQTQFAAMLSTFEEQIKSKERYLESGLKEDARRAGAPAGALRTSKTFECPEVKNMETGIRSVLGGAGGVGGAFAPSQDGNADLERAIAPKAGDSRNQKPSGYHEKSRSRTKRR